MRIEDFEIRFDVIDLIFCLNSTQQSLKLNEGTTLLLYEYYFTDLPEIRENVIDTAMIVCLRKRAGK